MKGREFATSKEVGMSRELMCERVVESIDGCLQNFTPRNRYELHLA
jgi:hypothetical protein